MIRIGFSSIHGHGYSAGIKHTSFFFISSLSTRACFALFSVIFCLNSSSFAFFSSSVNGAISSVDSEKLLCSLLELSAPCYIPMADSGRHTSSLREPQPVPCSGTSCHSHRTPSTLPLRHPSVVRVRLWDRFLQRWIRR